MALCHTIKSGTHNSVPYYYRAVEIMPGLYEQSSLLPMCHGVCVKAAMEYF